MRSIRIFHHEMEAQLAAGQLRAHGIEVVVRGAKEYASHVTGAGFGRYELLVGDADFADAQKLLLHVANTDESGESPEAVAPISRSSKTLLFALVGIFILSVFLLF